MSEGDEFEVYFHFYQPRATYIARSDEGIIIFPEPGTRMVPEMILGRWKIVLAKVRLKKIKETKPGKLVAIVSPVEWEGIYK